MLARAILFLAFLVSTARCTVLNDGNQAASGSINSNLKWQAASGKLTSGPCPGSTTYPIHITDCYQIYLTSNASQMLDPGHLDSPRQRVEFLTNTIPAGTAFAFKWRMYLSSTTGTSTHFFHLMQLKDNGVAAPLVTLTAVSGTVEVRDEKRPSAVRPSIPLSAFVDTTTVHFISGVAGSAGSLDYRVKLADGTQLLRYQATGEMGANAFVKYGTYRAAFAGMTAVQCAVGDFTLD